MKFSILLLVIIVCGASAEVGDPDDYFVVRSMVQDEIFWLDGNTGAGGPTVNVPFLLGYSYGNGGFGPSNHQWSHDRVLGVIKNRANGQFLSYGPNPNGAYASLESDYWDAPAWGVYQIDERYQIVNGGGLCLDSNAFTTLNASLTAPAPFFSTCDTQPNHLWYWDSPADTPQESVCSCQTGQCLFNGACKCGMWYYGAGCTSILYPGQTFYIWSYWNGLEYLDGYDGYSYWNNNYKSPYAWPALNTNPYPINTQQWQFVSTDKGTYLIKNANNGLCLDHTGGVQTNPNPNYFNPYFTPCSTGYPFSPGQDWHIYFFADGTAHIYADYVGNSPSSTCLDGNTGYTSSTTANINTPFLWPCQNAYNHLWSITTAPACPNGCGSKTCYLTNINVNERSTVCA